MLIGNAFIGAFLELTYAVLDFLVWVVIIGAVLSWLTAFGIINNYNRVVRMIGDFISRIAEPLLEPIRRILPPVGGLDLSPLALLFILYFLQSFIRHLAY